MSAEKYRSNLKNLFPSFLLMAAFSVYIFYLLQAIYVERALYADGANFFVELLTRDHIWPIADDSNHIRLFVNFINQLPVIFALNFGVTSLRVLRIAFGMGLFLTPLCLYLYCLYLSHRANDYRVLFFSIASLVTCVIPSDIFILNQAITSLAIVWVLTHYLLLNLKIKWIDWFIVSLSSIILFRSHESMILWGGALFIGSIFVIFLRDRGSINNKNLIVYVIGLFGFLQVAFVLYWLSSHPLIEQTSAYLQLIYSLNPSQLWIGNTRISLLIVVAVLLIFVDQVTFNCTARKLKIVRIIVSINLFFILMMMLASGIDALRYHELVDPWRQFSYRFLITFGATGWILISMAFVLVNKVPEKNIRPLTQIVLCIGIISASFWQISSNIQWSIFANAVSKVLQCASTTLVEPEEVRKSMVILGHENAYKYQWSWAWPVLGMSLQKSGEVDKLFKPDGYAEYFSPPRRIPFIPMSGGDIGSERVGLYRFDGFASLQ